MAQKSRSSKQDNKKITKKKGEKIKTNNNRGKITNLLKSIATAKSMAVVSVIFAILIAYFIKYHNSSDLHSVEPETHGGWRLPENETVATIGSEICNIDRKNAEELTDEIFEETYRHKKPVILFFKNGAKDWTDPEKWSFDSLRNEYGRWAVNSGNSIEIVRNGGTGDIVTSFSQFLERLFPKEGPIGDPFYMFDRSFFQYSSLPQTIKPPSYLKVKNKTDASIFLLGASRSGVSFHNHGDGWNGVVYGQKRWFIYMRERAPPGGIYPGYTQTEWYQKVYPNLSADLKPLECIQREGELLYIPEGAYHSTLNLGDTIAVAYQTTNYTLDTVKLHYEEQDIQGKMHYEKSLPDFELLVHESRSMLQKMLEIIPENAEIFNRLGVSFAATSEYESAIAHFDKAIDLDQFFVYAYANRGETYAKMGEHDLAENDLKYAIELSPKLWDSYATYGDFLTAHNRIKEAVELYKRGTQLEPTLASFWKSLKKAQKLLGDAEGAKKSEEQIKWLKKLGKGAGIHLAKDKTY